MKNPPQKIEAVKPYISITMLSIFHYFRFINAHKIRPFVFALFYSLLRDFPADLQPARHSLYSQSPIIVVLQQPIYVNILRNSIYFELTMQSELLKFIVDFAVDLLFIK